MFLGENIVSFHIGRRRRHGRHFLLGAIVRGTSCMLRAVKVGRRLAVVQMVSSLARLVIYSHPSGMLTASPCVVVRQRGRCLMRGE
jgi:hypothetical protein